MPRPDPVGPTRRSDLTALIAAMLGTRWRGGVPHGFAPGWTPRPKRPRGKDGEPERAPVEPPRPRPPLAGGAAAELEYDE